MIAFSFISILSSSISLHCHISGPHNSFYGGICHYLSLAIIYWTQHSALSTVTVDPGSNPDHNKLGGEIGKVKCLLREEALAGLTKMALKSVISEPHAV